MSKSELQNLILIFIVWKLVILLFSNLSQLILCLQTDFLGGGFMQYYRHPNFWGLINFDGEHYLSLAHDGYLPLTYFYFPFYPILVRNFSTVIGGSFFFYALSGLIISNLFFLLALVGIYRLAIYFYNNKTAFMAIILLLCFPTSFFLGSFYNDSLFLALAVWSFYFAIKRNWLPVIILAGFASATRVLGIALGIGIAIEYLFSELQLNQPLPLRGNPPNNILGSVTFKGLVKSILIGVFSMSGMLVYMLYLHKKTGNALEFFTNVSIFGEQRSAAFISLPQVLYRYFFKILPNVDYGYFPAVFTTYLEIVVAILAILLITIMFFKLRASLFIYSFLAFIIPTFSGSFSSMPRYVLAIFPIFILAGQYLSSKSKPIRLTIFSLLLISTFFAVSLFMRGYFVG